MSVVRDPETATRRGLQVLLVPLGLIAAALVVGTSAPAHACTCAQLALPSLAKQHDAVFVGTPVSVHDEGRKHSYEVRVSDVYKGSAAPTTTVRTARSPAACGIDLRLDKQYMILGAQPTMHGLVSTTLCSGTQPVSDDVIAEIERAIGPATPYRGADPGNDPRGNGTDDDAGDRGAENGNERESPGGADSDTAADADDEGPSTEQVVIGGLLALAIGASFLLPRLRHRRRGDD